MPLEQYQLNLKNGVYGAWGNGARNVCATMATGLGKSYTVSHIVLELAAPTVVIAHRTELVAQLSQSLAERGIRHALTLPGPAIKRIAGEHIRALGRSYYDERAHARVVSAQSIVDIDAQRAPWLAQARYWVVDEAHHLLRTNLWGRVVTRMPNALGLGVTATPIRAEGAGLGSHADGVFDALVEGPQLGEGIDMGFLTPYRLVCAESDIEIDSVPVSDATGDFNQVKLREVVHQSKSLVGDIVKTYQKHAGGKAAIAFVIDIEEAGKVAQAFRAAGVPAQAISSKTPVDLRNSIMADFKARRILVLVNVDLFGEGVDIPALEVVIMARHTASLSLFLQQAGRALRLNVSKELRALWSTFTPEERRAHIAASPKPFALIIDHVGNVVRHRFPCKVRQWSLDRREKRSRSAPADAIPLTTCLNVDCLQPYERHLTECPWCGRAPKPPEVKEAGPKQVDGDMVLVDPKLLRVLEGEVKRIDGPVEVPASLSPPAAGALKRNHHERQLAQRDLREAIALWAGYYNREGEADRVIHKRFFLTFGLPILEAMALNASEAGALKGKIEKVMESLK